MQIQTDSACGLISSGLLSDLTTLRIAKVMLLEIRRKLATSVRFVSPFAAGGACEEIQAELFDLVHIVTALLRAFVQSSRARSAYGNAVRVVVKKTAAQRNTNTAAAPVHSQKPRCQNTECRSMLRTGIAQDGFNRVSSNKDSLKKIPARGNSVTKDHVQNKRAVNRLRAQPFHAHQQAVNMPIAMKPAAERARNSCSRRIPNTSCRCCGTTKHVQSSAITPAAKASPVTRAARGEAISKFRRKYPANGSMNTAVKAIPQAGSQ